MRDQADQLVTGPHRFSRHPRLTLALVYAVLLLGIEGILQVLAPLWQKPPIQYRRPSPMPRGSMLNPLLHHDAVPGSAFVRNPSRFDSFRPVLNEFNSHGIRGPELRPKTLPRVFLVGDSFIEADEIEFDSTVGQRLNREFVSRFEFIAHGASGWSPTTQFSWTYRALSLEPDAVVLFLCVNDFFSANASDWVDQVYRRDAVWRDGIPIAYRLGNGTPKPPTWKDRLKRTYLVRIPYYALTRWRMRRDREAGRQTDLLREHLVFAEPAAAWPAATRLNADSVVDVVLRMGRYLGVRGVPLTVGIVPLGFAWPNEVRYVREAQHYNVGPGIVFSQAGLESYLEERLGAAGIRWLNLRPYFETAKQREPDQRLYLEADGHFNVNGHRVLHEALRDLASVWAPPPARPPGRTARNR